MPVTWHLGISLDNNPVCPFHERHKDRGGAEFRANPETAANEAAKGALLRVANCTAVVAGHTFGVFRPLS